MTRQLNVDWLFDDTFLIILDAVMVLSLWLLKITLIFQRYILKCYSYLCMEYQYLTENTCHISGRNRTLQQMEVEKSDYRKN